MQILEEVANAISNLTVGWTNRWAFADTLDKMESNKATALKNPAFFKQRGYDIADAYKQLETFLKCAEQQTLTLTQEDDEKVILAAKLYADNNRYIIETKATKDLKLFNARNMPAEAEKTAWGYKYTVYKDLMAFYFGYTEDFDFHKTFLKYMDFTEYLIKKYPDDNHFSQSDIGLYYVKWLVKKKQFERAKHIIETYTFKPRGKGETTTYEKIIAKLNDLKLLK